jgi:hypothetical protein
MRNNHKTILGRLWGLWLSTHVKAVRLYPNFPLLFKRTNSFSIWLDQKFIGTATKECSFNVFRMHVSNTVTTSAFGLIYLSLLWGFRWSSMTSPCPTFSVMSVKSISNSRCLWHPSIFQMQNRLHMQALN